MRYLAGNHMYKNKSSNKSLIFRSIELLLNKAKDNEFSEIINDWKWAFSYSKRYKWQIVIFTMFGIASTTFGLVSSIVNKYMLDIVTGRKVEMLWLLIVIWLSTNILSIVMNSSYSRYNAKVTAAIQKDVQQDVFHRILNADWMSLQKYTNGDMLDRINSDVTTMFDFSIKRCIAKWQLMLLALFIRYRSLCFFQLFKISSGISILLMAGYNRETISCFFISSKTACQSILSGMSMDCLNNADDIRASTVFCVSFIL